MRYVWFSLGFFAVHLGAYVLAGVVTQLYSRDIYHGDHAVLRGLVRDVSTDAEKQRQGLLMVPAQLVRAVLMSVVLYPLLDALGGLGFGARFAVLGGLMLVYTDLAAATPFPNTIEGWVYLEPRLTRRDVVLRISSEAVLHSLLFGGVAAWLLF